ncbi:MAG: histidinol-phosphate aminotransferase [Desulfatitalea sp. BRH_c12]|nr:MAG: histidinol-phosphate aminotransferase [Desulfatitalea sp. BRH_c12]
MNFNVPDYIKNIAPYVPGKPIEELEREYGISDSVKLASNENPLGPSPKAMAAIAHSVRNLHRYPDGAGFDLIQRLAAYLKVPPDRIVIGNGSDDLLGMLARVLLQPGDEVLVPDPSFLMYTIVAQSAGAVPIKVPLKELAIDPEAMLSRVGPRTRMVFICNPNNPTGAVVRRPALDALLAALPPRVVVVVDEAYFEFVRDENCISGLAYLDTRPAVVTLRTFSKAYGLAGLRVGYGVMAAPLAELLNRVRMPFNVNSLAQIAATAALDDDEFLNRTLGVVHEGMDFLHAELAQRGLRAFSSQANFFLVDVGRPADEVFQALLHHGVIVRSMRAYGYPRFIRVSIGLPEENRRFLKALDLVWT